MPGVQDWGWDPTNKIWVPLRVDSDGSLEVTVRNEAGFVGLEELATRLGFIGPWDLKGNVVFMEDFETELTDWIDESWNGGTIARSSRHKFSGDWSARLYIPDGEGPQAVMDHYIHFPGNLKYALFGRLYLDGSSQAVKLYIDLWDGIKKYEAGIHYGGGAGGSLSIVTTAGALYVVDALVLFSQGNPLWCPVMVTFNLATGYYDKLYFADKEYDVSTVPISVEDEAQGPFGIIFIWLETVNGFGCTVYIDDIILAKNVP